MEHAFRRRQADQSDKPRRSDDDRNAATHSPGNGSSTSLSRGILIAAAFSGVLNLLQLALPLYSMQLFDRVLPSGSLATLAVLTLVMAALIICSITLDGSRTQILGRISCRIDLRLYNRAVDSALAEGSVNLDSLRDVETLRAFLTSPVASAVLDAPWAFAFVVAIFCLHPLLGSVTLVAMLLMGGLSLSGYWATKRARATAVAPSRGAYSTLESMRVHRDVVEAMGLKRALLDRVFRSRTETLLAASRANDRQGWVDALCRGMRSAVQVSIIGLTAILVIVHDVQTGAIVASSMLFGRAIAPVERIGSGIHAIVGFVAAWKRAARTPLKPYRASRKLSLPALRSHLTVKGVTLRYAGRPDPVLSQAMFNVDSGTVLTVVGPEGAGKSSLARLLVGAIRPTVGEIRIDGSSLVDFDSHELGCQTGYLPQDVVFGSGTITEIIARFDTPIADEVIEAATLVGAHEIIQKLPQGYQTTIGEGRYPLSSGERQRIALARAVYRRPAFIVMDEPTTHLDDRGESDVVQAVQALKNHGSTVIIISRLPGLLHLSDQLMMLDNGRIRLVADQARLQEMTAPRLATSRDLAQGSGG